LADGRKPPNRRQILHNLLLVEGTPRHTHKKEVRKKEKKNQGPPSKRRWEKENGVGVFVLCFVVFLLPARWFHDIFQKYFNTIFTIF
jgi:hypothetical protein